MSNIEKIVVGLGIAVALFFGYGSSHPYVGGNFNPVVVDFAQGISVNGTQVINSAGAYLRAIAGTTISGTTGTFTGALTGTTASFTGAVTQGGGVTATSTTSSTVALQATDFDTENVVAITQNGIGNSAVTFPATSSLTAFIPTAGQERTIFFRNATTTASTTMSFAGGSGIILKSATTTTLGGSATGDNMAAIRFIRKSNGDINALLSIFN